MKTKPSFVMLAIVACAQSGLADPIDSTMGLQPLFGPLLALACEALAVAAFLRRWKFNFVRTLFAWFPITFATYLFLTGGLRVADRFAYDLAWRLNVHIQGILSVLPVVIFEVLVIGIEAFIIMRLAANSFFRNSSGPFTWKEALAVSVVGNILSFGLGMILRGIFIS